MTTTTNGTAPIYKAVVAELPDEYRLKIVQEQIQQQMIAVYSFEAAEQALPAGDPQRDQMRAQAARGRAIIAGYRVLESELIGRLNTGGG